MIKVLIVEDELLNAMAMQEIIAPWGFTFCEPAVTGEEALQRIETWKPDPDPDGREAARGTGWYKNRGEDS